jgi:regulator of sigma E protease
MGELFSFLVVIGIIIFIHEFGHFSMAKIFGIPVATFSLGFGPRLFGFKYRETEYKVSAIPLGGYVKIHGMEDQEAAPDDPNSFYNRPRYQRFLVLFMGVGFNMLLAIVLITTAFMLGRQVSKSIGMEGKIGIVKQDSPAAKAGLQPGDVILEMKGQKTPTWEEIIYATLLNPNEVIPVKVRRGDKILDMNVFVEREKVNNLGYIGIAPATNVIVSQLVPDKPAILSGLKVNDLILSIDGKEIHDPLSVVTAIQQSQGKPLNFMVERIENGQKVTKTLSIQPVKSYEAEPISLFQKLLHREPKKDLEGKWVIGFLPGEPTVLKKLPFGEALKESFRTCREQIRLNGIFLAKLFQGQLSLKATSGPFQIAGFSQAAREGGLSSFLTFIGTISFDIGLINLLPIPALDGGHIFFLILEGIFRREFSIKLKERLTMIGFVFLISLMVVVLYYDILKTGPVQRLIETLGTR